MKRIAKGIVSLILIAGFITGFCLMCSEPALDATTWDIIKVNGGGVVLMTASLLIVSILNREEDKNLEQKGGKYYGIR